MTIEGIPGVPTPESTEPQPASEGGIPGMPASPAGNGAPEPAAETSDPLPAPSIPRRPFPKAS